MKLLCFLCLLVTLSGCANFNNKNEPAEYMSRHEQMETIRKKIESTKQALYVYFLKAREANSDLKGAYLFKFSIIPTGAVKDFEVLSSELADEQLNTFIEREIKSLNFGHISENETKVEYKFVFLPN